MTQDADQYMLFVIGVMLLYGFTYPDGLKTWVKVVLGVSAAACTAPGFWRVWSAALGL